MVEQSVAKRLVDAVVADFPDHAPGTRPVHTIGIGVTGHFKATTVARDYCTAEHFQGQDVPVTVRFSNGSGSPVQHDGWSDARGMATRFHLAQEGATDLIGMTICEFFAPTVEEFLAFSASARMSPVARESGWAKIVDMLHLKMPLPDPMPGQRRSGAPGSMVFANHHRSTQIAAIEAATIGAPSSYARATYSAVHSFVVTAPDATRRHVRFQWRPVAGIKLIDPTQAGDDRYLHGELRARLAHWPAQFLLVMTIGEDGDDVADPTTPWPLKRRRIVMGSLTLTTVAADQQRDCERIAFNPCRLVPGIDLSDDPILAARRDAYEVSREERHGTPCPFHSA
ncbi:MAG TPA: catalase [Sphingomonas sp.]|nr:catalase [Sphingomonas sp.]